MHVHASSVQRTGDGATVTMESSGDHWFSLGLLLRSALRLWRTLALAARAFAGCARGSRGVRGRVPLREARKVLVGVDEKEDVRRPARDFVHELAFEVVHELGLRRALRALRTVSELPKLCGAPGDGRLFAARGVRVVPAREVAQLPTLELHERPRRHEVVAGGLDLAEGPELAHGGSDPRRRRSAGAERFGRAGVAVASLDRHHGGREGVLLNFVPETAVASEPPRPHLARRVQRHAVVRTASHLGDGDVLERLDPARTGLRLVRELDGALTHVVLVVRPIAEAAVLRQPRRVERAAAGEPHGELCSASDSRDALDAWHLDRGFLHLRLEASETELPRLVVAPREGRAVLAADHRVRAPARSSNHLEALQPGHQRRSVHLHARSAEAALRLVVTAPREATPVFGHRQAVG
mmetsp:Transcript_29681/g.96678  ORF Transcript_29681/g.96678 Transcript_29681/m.96678 type:complete len:411 (-) Transcript_29681:162-1394(-)